MKIFKILLGIVGYAASIGLALVFALYLSGRIGWFIILAFLLAPIVSYIVTLIFIRHIYISGELNENVIGKGEFCSLNLKIRNRFFIPSPVIVLETETSSRAVSRDCKICASVMPFKTEKFNVDFKAAICGRAYIGVKNIIIKDYLSLFSFRLKNVNMDNLCFYISVIPDVGEVEENSKILADIAQACILTDEGDDTSESLSAGFGGFPGYDNRDYIPGDPLKRINWKLSAKRNRLLVRLDDEGETTPVTLVFDSCFNTAAFIREAVSPNSMPALEDELVALTEQDTIENGLGIIFRLINVGFVVNVWVKNKQSWECYCITNEGGLSELRLVLAGYEFNNAVDTERLPYDKIMQDKGSVLVLCTPVADNELKGLVSALGAGGKSQLNTVIYSVIGED